MAVVQMTPGPLIGRFSAVHLEGISLLMISTNQVLLLNGDRGEDFISFSLELTGNSDDHRVQCQAFEPLGLYGFNQNLRESHFQLGAGSVSLISIASSTSFHKLLARFGHDHLIETLLSSNTLRLDPDRHHALCNQMMAVLETPPLTLRSSYFTGQKLIAALIDSLQSRSDHFVTFSLTSRNQLVRELVQWATLNQGSNANLDQICEQLYTSRRTLILGTKDNFKCGPMELLRIIRLQQVHTLLRCHKTRKSAHLSTISEVAQHCGFRSRGHFARAYRAHFGETPRATLMSSLA
jgi:AraC family ethanolamine operon transcriptional activator